MSGYSIQLAIDFEQISLGKTLYMSMHPCMGRTTLNIPQTLLNIPGTFFGVFEATKILRDVWSFEQSVQTSKNKDYKFYRSRYNWCLFITVSFFCFFLMARTINWATFGHAEKRWHRNGLKFSWRHHCHWDKRKLF